MVSRVAANTSGTSVRRESAICSGYSENMAAIVRHNTEEKSFSPGKSPCPGTKPPNCRSAGSDKRWDITSNQTDAPILYRANSVPKRRISSRGLKPQSAIGTSFLSLPHASSLSRPNKKRAACLIGSAKAAFT